MSSFLDGSIAPFNKTIISLWFRAPLEALKRLQEFNTLAKGGVLPLLTFGGTSKTYSVLTKSAGSASYTITSYVTPGGTCDWTPSHVQTVNVNTGTVNSEGAAGEDIGPSYLGIYKKTGGYGLVLFLLTGSTGDGSGFGQNTVTSNSSYGEGSPTGAMLDCNVQTHFDFGTRTFRSGSVAPGNPRVTTNIASDDGGIALRGRGNDYYTALEGIDIQPDTWHHLLLSFDISAKTHGVSQQGSSTAGDFGDTFVSTPASLSNPAKIWAALDDVNYTGPALRAPFGDTVGSFLSPNEFASNNTQLAAASQVGGSFHEAGWALTGSWVDAFTSNLPIEFTASGAPLPTDPFGIPTAHNFQNQMKHIELAEFQMWTGKTLDTSVRSNRRLFIAPKKNKDGGQPLKPVVPKKAKEELGDPDILFHRSSNWKKGKNTGKASGSEFHPSGKIESFKPEPEVGK